MTDQEVREAYEGGYLTKVARELDRRLAECETFGDLQELLAFAETVDMTLWSKRGTKYTGPRKLFAFTADKVERDQGGALVYSMDPTCRRTAYLYDDTEHSGTAYVRNLTRHARFGSV